MPTSLGQKAVGNAVLAKYGKAVTQKPVNYSGTGQAAPPAAPPQVANRRFAMTNQQYRGVQQQQPRPPQGMAAAGGNVTKGVQAVGHNPNLLGTTLSRQPAGGGSVNDRSASLGLRGGSVGLHGSQPGQMAAPGPQDGASVNNAIYRRLQGGSSDMSTHPNSGAGTMTTGQQNNAPSQDARGTYVRGAVHSDMSPDAVADRWRGAGKAMKQAGEATTDYLRDSGETIQNQFNDAYVEGGVVPTEEERATNREQNQQYTDERKQEATQATGGAAGGMFDAGKVIGALMGAGPAGVAEAFNVYGKDAVNRFYGGFSELDPISKAGNAMLDPAAQAQADAAQRAQMFDDINEQRDGALRQQLGMQSRGGRMGSGGTQGTYNAAIAQQQEGSRKLLQDQFAREMQRTQLGSDMLGNVANTKYGLMQEAFNNPQEIMAIWAQMLGEAAPDVSLM